MNGLATQQRLEQALRYLRETGKYALAQPVEKKPVDRPFLTQWRETWRMNRELSAMDANEGGRA